MSGAHIAAAVLSLVAGVGVFLAACGMMSENLEAVGKRKLERLFSKVHGRLAGVAVGAVATAVVQSSSAVSVSVIGLVNAGVMTLFQAAAVLFGANIGTTVTGQLAALGAGFGGGLSISIVFAALGAVGAFVRAFCSSDRARRVGGILSGFGLLFVGLDMMGGAARSFAEIGEIRAFLALFDNIFLVFLVGALLTALFQSSSVMTSLVISMTASGLISLDQGIYLVIGANVGTCATAFLVGLAGTRAAKRVALIHLLFNVSGAALFMLIGSIMRLFGCSYGMLLHIIFVSGAAQLSVAAFHTFFNVATVAAVLPFTDRIVGLVVKLIPDNPRARSLSAK